MVAHDRPQLAARVARQTRVPDRIDVTCANSLSGVKACGRRYVAARWPSRCKHRRHLVCLEYPACHGRCRSRPAALQLGPCHKACLKQQLRETRDPPFVVAHSQVIGRGDQLLLVTPSGVRPATVDRHAECEYAPFPRRTEHRLILLRSDWPHILHAAHVVDAIHARPPSAGAATRETPIIASRVTSAASSDSAKCSAPGGRSGNTR